MVCFLCNHWSSTEDILNLREGAFEFLAMRTVISRVQENQPPENPESPENGVQYCDQEALYCTNNRRKKEKGSKGITKPEKEYIMHTKWGEKLKKTTIMMEENKA